MLTINVGDHPPMRRMHRARPDRPASMQDMRSVIPVERVGVDRWLTWTADDARALMRLAPLEVVDAASIA